MQPLILESLDMRLKPRDLKDKFRHLPRLPSFNTVLYLSETQSIGLIPLVPERWGSSLESSDMLILRLRNLES